MATQQPATFKSTLIIYWAMFLGQFLIGTILMFVMDGEEKTPDAPFDIIIPLAAIMGAAGAYFIGHKRKGSIPIAGTVQEKLDHYRTSNVLKYALAEGGNLIALILIFTMAGTNYLIWFGLGLVAFVLLRPNKDQFKMEYEIGHGERFM